MEGLLALPPKHVDPKLKNRADYLMEEILNQLGPQAKAKPDDARLSVIFAASLYQPLAEHYAKAPSRKKLREQLEVLRDSAGRVATLYERRDLYLLGALHMHGLPEDEVRALGWGQSSPGLDFLKRLCAAAHAAIVNLPLAGSVGGQKASSTPPKRALALWCWEIFESYRPGKASTTEGGDFRGFVTLVYEIATGELDADLETPVKEAVALVRDQGSPTGPNPFAEALNPHLKYVRDLDALRRS